MYKERCFLKEVKHVYVFQQILTNVRARLTLVGLV